MTSRRAPNDARRLFVLLLLVLCSAVACGRDRNGDEGKSRAEPGAQGGSASSPEAAGRVLRIPVPADPGSLNPLIPRPRRSLDFSSLLFPSLLVARPKGADVPEVQGDLARWWQWDPEKHTLTCALRGGRLWEDTTRVSIADVVRSYEAYRALGWFAPRAPGDSLPDVGLASVQAIDDSTVRLAYRSDFSFWRALSAASWPILPARKLNDLAVPMLQANAIGREPLSGGPFRVSDWRSGLNLWLAPQPFAGQSRRSPFDRVEFDVCPGIDARILRLGMGRADLVLDVPVERLSSLIDRSSGAKLHHAGVESVEMLFWNLHGAAARSEIRTAVSLAIDRERLVRSLLVWRDEVCGGPAGGLMEPAGPEADSLEQEGAMLPDSVFVEADTSFVGPSPPLGEILPTRYAPMPRFDRTAAEALLDAAGWSERDADGFRVRDGQRLRIELLYDRSNLLREALATWIESDLARVGIELAVQPVDGSVLAARLRSGLYATLLTGFRPPAFPDPSLLWSSRGYWNGTGFSSVVVDSLCSAIEREEDAGRLRRHVRRLESVLRRGGPVTFLVYREWTALVGPRIQGFAGRADDPLRGLEQVRPTDAEISSAR